MGDKFIFTLSVTLKGFNSDQPGNGFPGTKRLVLSEVKCQSSIRKSERRCIEAGDTDVFPNFKQDFSKRKAVIVKTLHGMSVNQIWQDWIKTFQIFFSYPMRAHRHVVRSWKPGPDCSMSKFCLRDRPFLRTFFFSFAQCANSDWLTHPSLNLHRCVKKVGRRGVQRAILKRI